MAIPVGLCLHLNPKIFNEAVEENRSHEWSRFDLAVPYVLVFTAVHAVNNFRTWSRCKSRPKLFHRGPADAMLFMAGIERC